MSADRVVYLDSSALVKLVVNEGESAALVGHLAERPVRASSALARVEVVRAARPHGAVAVTRARQVLSSLRLIAMDQVLLDLAAELPEGLRSLDAIHVAAASALAEDLDELITYDRRMAAAAGELGIAVSAPGT